MEVGAGLALKRLVMLERNLNDFQFSAWGIQLFEKTWDVLLFHDDMLVFKARNATADTDIHVLRQGEWHHIKTEGFGHNMGNLFLLGEGAEHDSLSHTWEHIKLARLAWDSTIYAPYFQAILWGENGHLPRPLCLRHDYFSGVVIGPTHEAVVRRKNASWYFESYGKLADNVSAISTSKTDAIGNDTRRKHSCRLFDDQFLLVEA